MPRHLALAALAALSAAYTPPYSVVGRSRCGVSQLNVRSAVRMQAREKTTVATKSVLINAPTSLFYDILADVDKYPVFCRDVESVTVLPSPPEIEGEHNTRLKMQMRKLFGIDMWYTIDCVGIPGKSLQWTLHESNQMETNTGGWTLEDMGDGTTMATYGVAVDLKAGLPKFVVNFMVKTSFPAVLGEFKARAEKLSGQVVAHEAFLDKLVESIQASTNEAITSLRFTADQAICDALHTEDPESEMRRLIALTVDDATVAIQKLADETTNQIGQATSQQLELLSTQGQAMERAMEDTVLEIKQLADESKQLLAQRVQEAQRQAQVEAQKAQLAVDTLRTDTLSGVEQTLAQADLEVKALSGQVLEVQADVEAKANAAKLAFITLVAELHRQVVSLQRSAVKVLPVQVVAVLAQMGRLAQGTIQLGRMCRRKSMMLLGRRSSSEEIATPSEMVPAIEC